ncbi:unnamed protein product [Thlaspi arvense]|uniref:Reverse transcriptase zinc-binding domain-containing protein n=1 Tax=Thlaspi arvense TaxID=13288 RepID=A0AAU9SRB9_THLAR|nr:unnamed protein product [Thlaspi arvense]
MTTPTVPYGPRTSSAASLKVKDLLCQTSNEWDLEAIRRYLPQYEGQIRQLITGRSKPKDKLVWLSDKSGDYTVKTGYNLLRMKPEDQRVDNFNWKANIWQLKISPKLKSFLWKAMRGALPSMINDADLTSPKCNRAKPLCETDSPTINAIDNTPTSGTNFGTALPMVALEHLDRQESFTLREPCTISGKHNLDCDQQAKD